MGIYLGSSPVSLYIGGQNNNVTIIPTGITVTTPPTKTSYKAGEKLDISGIVVKVRYSDESEVDITSECTFSPTNDSVVYEDTTDVEVSWVWDGLTTFTATQPITVTRVLSSITLTGPTKTSYHKDETLDLTGLVVTAHYNSGTAAIVTSYTTSPAPGATLSTLGNITVTVSYSENGVTKTANFSIVVNVKIVSWATGSDENVAAMIRAAHNGQIKLADYWAVGDTRTVNLSAGVNNIDEDMSYQDIPAQAVELVLAHKPTSTKYYGGGEFIINQKDCLSVASYMDNPEISSGTFDGSIMAKFLNDSSNGYLKMLPTWLSSVLLDAKVITSEYFEATTNKTSTHKVFLPAEREVFDTNGWSSSTEFNALEQWTWFKAAANRIKQVNNTNSIWWERSPNGSYWSSYCIVSKTGEQNESEEHLSYGVAPAMLI